MPRLPQFSPGDVVIHTTRPEWGEGTVDQATRIDHEGTAAQRLIVQFTRRGRVTLNTAVASLVSKDAAIAMNNHATSTFSSGPRASTDGARGWLAALEDKGNSHELHRLPDTLTDPFRNMRQRLEATLDTYRFSTEPRSLIDWAAAQTGLEDPMSKYTRHELEQAFSWYSRDRDQHLRDLLKQFKAAGKLDEVDQLRRRITLPAAVSALDKARNSL